METISLPYYSTIVHELLGLQRLERRWERLSECMDVWEWNVTWMERRRLLFLVPCQRVTRTCGAVLSICQPPLHPTIVNEKRKALELSRTCIPIPTSLTSPLSSAPAQHPHNSIHPHTRRPPHSPDHPKTLSPKYPNRTVPPTGPPSPEYNPPPLSKHAKPSTLPFRTRQHDPSIAEKGPCINNDGKNRRKAERGQGGTPGRQRAVPRWVLQK